MNCRGASFLMNYVTAFVHLSKIAKCYGITSKKEQKEVLHQMGMVRYYPDVKEVKDVLIE